MRKKVAIVGTVGLPAKYGGFETLAEHFVNQKGDEFDILVYCSKKAYPEGPVAHEKATLKYLPLNANGIQSIPYDIWSILYSVRKADRLLILGVSGCIILPFVKLITRKKIVVNIDGLEWKRDKWGKFARKFLKFSEKLAVRYADEVIADNKVIQDHVKKSYEKKAQLIAYGGDHTRSENISSDTFLKFPFLKEPYAFKVCRIEPENNIELILKAFSKSGKLNLVIIGNWENSDYSSRLKTEYDNVQNIFLLDPIYDQRKLNEIRSNCLLYVHGHSAGGTNPSLVEAMYLGLPILAYGINYNRESTKNQALYFDDKDSLVSALSKLESLPLKEVGEKMSDMAKEEYMWVKVANAYARLFI